jgi:hypothetical protein
MWLTGPGDKLCGLLSALFHAAAYHPSAVSPSAFPGFVYSKFLLRSASCPAALLWCTQRTLHVPFQFLVYYSFFFFREGFSLSRGLSQFIPGVTVNTMCCLFAHLLVCVWQVWSWHLTAQEPSCFLSVKWHGETLYGLGIQGVRVLLLLGGFFLPSVAPASQQNI